MGIFRNRIKAMPPPRMTTWYSLDSHYSPLDWSPLFYSFNGVLRARRSISAIHS